MEVVGLRKMAKAKGDAGEGSGLLAQQLRESEEKISNKALELIRERLAEITNTRIYGKLIDAGISKNVVEKVSVFKTDTGVSVQAGTSRKECERMSPIVRSVIEQAGKEAKMEVTGEVMTVGFELCIARIYSGMVELGVAVGRLDEFSRFFEVARNGDFMYLTSKFPEEWKMDERVSKITDGAYKDVVEEYIKPILGVVLNGYGSTAYTSLRIKGDESQFGK